MTNRKHILRGSVLVFSTIIVLGSATSSLANSNLPVLASSNADDSTYGDSTFDVNQVVQAEDGEYTSVVLTINNDSDEEYFIDDANANAYEFSTQGMSGITVTDENDTVHYPLQDDKKNCLCSGDTLPDEFVNFLPIDESNTYWASYILPKDTGSISVEVPGFGSVEVDIE